MRRICRGRRAQWRTGGANRTRRFARFMITESRRTHFPGPRFPVTIRRNAGNCLTHGLARARRNRSPALEPEGLGRCGRLRAAGGRRHGRRRWRAAAFPAARWSMGSCICRWCCRRWRWAICCCRARHARAARCVAAAPIFGIRFVVQLDGRGARLGHLTFPFQVRAIRLALEAQEPGLVPSRRDARRRRVGPLVQSAPCRSRCPASSAAPSPPSPRAWASSAPSSPSSPTFPAKRARLPLAIYTAIQSPGGEAAAARLSAISIALALDRASPWPNSRTAACARADSDDERRNPPARHATFARLRARCGFRLRSRRHGAVRAVGRGQVHHRQCRRGIDRARRRPHRARRRDPVRFRARHLRSARARRRIGVVFQDARLFPHLSRGGQPALRLAPRADMRRERTEIAHIVDLLGLGACSTGDPRTLSGGETIARGARPRASDAAPRPF